MKQAGEIAQKNWNLSYNKNYGSGDDIVQKELDKIATEQINDLISRKNVKTNIENYFTWSGKSEGWTHDPKKDFLPMNFNYKEEMRN